MAAVAPSALADDEKVEFSDSPPRQLSGWIWPLGVGVFATLMRLAFAADRVTYSNPDELRYLAIARTLTGDVDWYVGGPTFSPGFPTLIAPIHWLTSDPATVQRFALAVNAVLGGLLAALLLLLGRQLTHLSYRWCAAAALLGASVPAAFAQSLWAAPETLLAVIFAGIVLASVRLLARPRFSTGLIVVVLAPLGYLAHGRFLPLVVSSFVLIGWLAYRRRLPRVQVGLLLGVLAILTLAAQRYTYWAIDVTWIETQNSRVDSVLDRVRRPDRIARSTLGMTWYQLVTTLGVTGLGAWVVGAALGRHRTVAPLGLRRRDAAVVVLHMLPLAGLAAVFMAGSGDRLAVAHMVYGRYWEAFVAPLVLLGLLYISAAARVTLIRSVGAVVATTAGAAILLVIVRGDEITESTAARGGIGIGRRIVGLVPFLRDPRELDVLEVTLIAIVMMSIAYSPILLPRGARATRAASFALLALFAVIGIWMIERHIENRRSPDPDRLAAITAPFESGIIPSGATVHFASDGLADVWHRYQSEVTDIALPRLNPADPDRPDFVIARPRDPTMKEWGAEVIWEDPYRRVVIWAVPPD